MFGPAANLEGTMPQVLEHITTCGFLLFLFLEELDDSKGDSKSIGRCVLHICAVTTLRRSPKLPHESLPWRVVQCLKPAQSYDAALSWLLVEGGLDKQFTGKITVAVPAQRRREPWRCRAGQTNAICNKLQKKKIKDEPGNSCHCRTESNNEVIQ
jgi:hypothetical protein